ncbi:polymer-forming cytoskeletal protein [Candidatus Uhrbacteria bacterium]|nr:polymer-forming cytoskeletal protein [Candidatus Uhrbacteria bacterium]
MTAALESGTNNGLLTDALSTMIAKGVTLEGNFASEGSVQIEGNVNGHVKTSASLIVGSESKIIADVLAESATIAGKIQGNVSVTHKLHLLSTAHITGDIHCASIAVDAGAIISGKVEVGSLAG